MVTAAPIRIHRPGAVSLAALPPLALYVHLPWCLKKCPYCDFNSHEKGIAFDEARYIDALFADLESALPQVWGRRVVSVFIGGGTPSLFSPGSIERLIAGIRARLPLEPGCEITLEANPGTFERERFRAYRAAGVTPERQSPKRARPSIPSTST
jgi:coproporphyrinogen III oxidase-like Fe-S oxidoreductase